MVNTSQMIPPMVKVIKTLLRSQTGETTKNWTLRITPPSLYQTAQVAASWAAKRASVHADSNVTNAIAVYKSHIAANPAAVFVFLFRTATERRMFPMLNPALAKEPSRM